MTKIEHSMRIESPADIAELADRLYQTLSKDGPVQTVVIYNDF